MENETKQTEVVSTENKVEQVSIAEKTISVDIYGVEVELPISKAKQLIEKRDNKTKEYNDIKNKIVVAESQVKQEAEKVALLEAMKRNSVEEVEAQVSSKYTSRIKELENKLLDREIESSLLSIEGFNKEALSDAKTLFKASHSDLNETNLTERLKQFAELKKDLFGSARKVVSTGLSPLKQKNENKVQPKSTPSLSNGIGKMLGSK